MLNTVPDIARHHVGVLQRLTVGSGLKEAGNPEDSDDDSGSHHGGQEPLTMPLLLFGDRGNDFLKSFIRTKGDHCSSKTPDVTTKGTELPAQVYPGESLFSGCSSLSGNTGLPCVPWISDTTLCTWLS